MKKQIRIVTAAVILAVAAAAAAVAVYAYIQSKVEQPNTFQIAEGSVEITETFTEPEIVSMDNTFQKVVSVKNTGTSDQYVRVFLSFSDSAVREKSRIVYANSSEGKSWSEFLADLPEDWVFIPETDATLGGYFYYTRILPPGSTTPPLIQGIKTSFGSDANADQITDYDVIVYTESVQTVEIASGTVYGPATEEDPTPWRTAWEIFLDRP